MDTSYFYGENTDESKDCDNRTIFQTLPHDLVKTINICFKEIKHQFQAIERKIY